MFLFQSTGKVQVVSPIANLNKHNVELESSIQAWRNLSNSPQPDITAINKSVNNVAILAFKTIGAAAAILDPNSKDKAPENSPQYQVALRAMMFAKRTMEELDKQKFGTTEAYKYKDGPIVTVANAVAHFNKEDGKADGDYYYTTRLTNAAYQDTYFKNYFAVLFSPSLQGVDKLSATRLANALTDAARLQSATIKIPFKNKTEAKDFAEVAKSGGIPYCKVVVEPVILDNAGFTSQSKILLLSIIYDKDYLPPATTPSAPKQFTVAGIKMHEIAKVPANQESKFIGAGIYGAAPTLEQLKEKDNTSSAHQKKTPYSFFVHYQYAEKFNEVNPDSEASARLAFRDLINNYMRYMGVSLDNYKPPIMAEFFKAQAGQDFLAEFKNFCAAGAFTGYATVENKKQVEIGRAHV